MQFITALLHRYESILNIVGFKISPRRRAAYLIIDMYHAKYQNKLNSIFMIRIKTLIR